MAKSVTYNKRENEKKKQARRAEKQKKKEDRKLLGKANSFDDRLLPNWILIKKKLSKKRFLSRPPKKKI